VADSLVQSSSSTLTRGVFGSLCGRSQALPWQPGVGEPGECMHDSSDWLGASSGPGWLEIVFDFSCMQVGCLTDVSGTCISCAHVNQALAETADSHVPLEPGHGTAFAPAGPGPSARAAYQTTENCIRRAWLALQPITPKYFRTEEMLRIVGLRLISAIPHSKIGETNHYLSL
jgi:hypothetical protein